MSETSDNGIDIVAFDLSLTGTGCAVYCGDHQSITVETLVPPKKMVGMQRLDWILKAVASNWVDCRTEIVIFEDLAFAAHDRNHERAGLATMVRYMLWQKNIPYVLVAPTTLKKYVTGSGKGDKSQMQLAVFKHWGFDSKNDNEADACGLLHIGMALMGLETKLTKAQQECLMVIRKNNSEALSEIIV